MGQLDKDLKQKEGAVRFAVLRGYLPFLEVFVENRKELSDASTIITDIDVLASSIDASGAMHRIAFDCKTLGKTSPINRALWAAGLLRYTSCDEAFVILRKKASEAHRLSAIEIDVHLFDEKQFANYAESYAVDYKLDYCYSTDIQSWVAHSKLYSASGGFGKFGRFLNNEVPLEDHAERGVKRLLAALLRGCGEFDPTKATHQAIFQHSVMVFSFLLAKIVHELKNIIDFDADKIEFERILKFYMWGGREAYQRRQKMAHLFASSNQSFPGVDPELNEWNDFIELVRKLLDAPHEVFRCCFIARELSFRNVVPRVPEKEIYLAKWISESSRTRQFTVAQARYLYKAAKLPREFEVDLVSQFDELKGRM